MELWSKHCLRAFVDCFEYYLLLIVHYLAVFCKMLVEARGVLKGGTWYLIVVPRRCFLNR